MDVERTFTVARPIEEVFTYLADFENTNRWDPGTQSTTRTGGDGGLGTTYHNRSEFLGRQVELTYTTTIHEPPTAAQFEGRNDKALTHDTLRLSPATGPDGAPRTQIHYRADFDLGVVLNVVAPLVLRKKLSALADETVAKLTAELESSAPT